MKQFTYTVTDPAGIHARPAGILARAVRSVDSIVTIGKEGGKSVPADRVMGVMALAIKPGDPVVITVEGGDESASLAALKTFCSENL